MSKSFNMAFGYYKEAEIAKKEHWPILIPVGTMEYHSTHCPYGCDTLTAIGAADKVAEKIYAMVMPPIWYGVSSYAVAGPEKNSIQVNCDTLELYVYDILKSLFLAGYTKNIYILIAHQTEDYLPMTLACMKAAKKLTMEYLEEKGGYGWWGKNENKEFYENLVGNDSPWNWIRVIRLISDTTDDKFMQDQADHAGIYECSQLESLYPGSIKLERLKDSNDWFAESAKDMSVELGDQINKGIVDGLIKIIKG